MRKLGLGLVVGVMVSSAMVAAAAPPIKLMINGEETKVEVPPQIIKGRTMVPIRAAAEGLGAAVKWDEARRTIFVSGGSPKREGTQEFNRGGSATSPVKLVINGKEVKSEVAPQLMKGRALVPIRAVAEGLGYGVAWNDSQNSVWMTNQIVNPSAKDFNGQALITLSYDDGLDSFYDDALPLHEKYGIPATLNVITERIKGGADSEFLDAGQIKHIYDKGIEIGSHTYSHYDPLTSNTDEDLEFELAKSKQMLLEIVPEVNSIAIPFSRYDPRVREFAKKHYKAVRVFEHKQNNLPPSDPYWLHSSIAVTNETTFAQVKARIDEAVKNKKWCIIMLHGIDPKNDELYEIKPALLEQILEYVNRLGRDKILPINTIDAVNLSPE
ncbi:stalk domain-containing protein [Ammoniphilus resinae]|uniref:Peptidoglycan/xylan/chitin deacetylase (PgdA/CDA1 family) n=1 Tax=Ammoniphilus resinae TaxID=861532 RepID=A0ABS4GXF4_9BACL|nr:stalk domain-containing protein [Ammoniphilus resinae]MBP1934948.1 peptidoglycan/xylan/chitin deacetylase (PgdA/CDA1 family) [Ammoniphilus resinae]